VPPQLAQVEIPGFEEPYLFIKNTAGLVALVQMGVLEIHPWGAKVDRPDRPDRIVFDLDPGEGLQFADVVAAAHDVRDCLGRIGLTAFAKTTGGKGLHVVVPVARRHNWARIKAFAREVATAIAKRAPEHYLTRLSKAERRGRIFIDYLRNDPTATAVCPYSSRARTGAPVSTPLAWDEVAAGLDPASFTIRTVPDRLVRLGRDPWAEMASLRQGLPAQVAA
jgi:bifunctional non-homologous end joining protein LigD